MAVKSGNERIQAGNCSIKFKRLSRFLNGGVNLPVLAFLALIPLLGLVFFVMILFGQQPSDVIRLWTETAEWTLSQQVATPNVYQDMHYLCTVSAGGHHKVVKPLRTGKRHGHTVLVNRQLCIANAFEQVIQQRTPCFHKAIRGFYDRTGYPIAKHIRSKFAADAVYLLMKPLEWLFLLVLYATTVNPEDRIAIQYPHAKVPEKK